MYKSGKIAFVQELKISRESFPPDVNVGILLGIAIGKDYLYMPDIKASNIKVLTTAGKYVSSFGTKGKGPSDLSQPFLAVISANNLIVWESGNRRFSYFDFNGKFLKHVIPKNTGSIVQLKSFNDGRFIAERNLFGFVNKKYNHYFGLELYSKGGELIKTIYKKAVYRRKFINHPRKKFILLPFHPDYYWDILPGNKVVIGNSKNYQLEIMELDSGKSNIITHSFKPVRVTEKDKTDFLDNIVSSGPRGRPKMGADTFTRANTPFPTQKPAFKRIISDCDGNVLVFKYKDRKKDNANSFSALFDAFDNNGKFINEVKIYSSNDFSLYSSIPQKGNVFWVATQGKEMETLFFKYRAK
jgi:hypothetical protein